MVHDYYDSNMAFLKENSLFLYNILTNEEPKYPDIQVSRVDSKDLNFILSDKTNRCYLNSLRHRGNQMTRLMDQIGQDTEMLVVFGFECGFFLEEIFNNRPMINHIIVIEPCLQLFKEVLMFKNIKPVFMKNKSVSIVLNRNVEEAGELVAYLIKNERRKKIEFIGHITYRTLFPGMYEQVVESARDSFFSESANLITLYHTLHLYSANVMKNQKHDCILAESLFQELRKLKCPAIIVSAGPSLIKDLPVIRELRKKALIVAVGTAIRVLDTHGIKPHLRVAIDGFPSECIFEGIDTRSVPLLYSEKIHSDVLGKYEGLKYKMILDVDWISKFFYHQTGYEQTLVRSGYSVANLTLDLLARLGFGRIILIGQDLCYHKKRLYAEGARGNDEIDYSGPGFVKATNKLGEEVYSSIQLLSMKKLFERLIKQHPNTEVINATEVGLPIVGTKNMTIREAMENAEIEVLLEDIHERVKNNQCDNSHMRPIIHENYKKFIEENEEILNVNTQRVEYLKLVAKYENIDSHNGKNKIFVEFKERLVKFYDRLNKIDLYQYVFYPSLENIILNLRETYAYSGEDIPNQIQSLYKSVLAETTEVQRYAYLLKELSKELPLS